MLEFIVLGQVPGTDIILPFAVVAPILAVVFAAGAYYYYFTSPNSKKSANKNSDIAL